MVSTGVISRGLPCLQYTDIRPCGQVVHQAVFCKGSPPCPTVSDLQPLHQKTFSLLGCVRKTPLFTCALYRLAGGGYNISISLTHAKRKGPLRGTFAPHPAGVCLEHNIPATSRLRPRVSSKMCFSPHNSHALAIVRCHRLNGGFPICRGEQRIVLRCYDLVRGLANQGPKQTSYKISLGHCELNAP